MGKSNLADLPGPEDLLGPRLRAARKKAELTVLELHDLTRISKSSIARYESGDRQPPAKELRQLCDVLEVSPNFLLYGDDQLEFGSRLTSVRELNIKTNRQFFAAANLLLVTLSRSDREALLQLLFSLVSAKLKPKKLERLKDLIHRLAKGTEILEEKHSDSVDELVMPLFDDMYDENQEEEADDQTDD